MEPFKNTELSALVGKDGPFPMEFLKRTSQPIRTVDHVHIIELSLNGSRVALITAAGTVTTTGWSDGQLEPYIYVQPPPDGIWDFVFIAEPPSGPAGDVISPIAANYFWLLGSFQLKGVRIHSATNSITKKI